MGETNHFRLRERWSQKFSSNCMYEKRHSLKKGIGLFATQNISESSLIFEEKPLVVLANHRICCLCFCLLPSFEFPCLSCPSMFCDSCHNKPNQLSNHKKTCLVSKALLEGQVSDCFLGLFTALLYVYLKGSVEVESVPQEQLLKSQTALSGIECLSSNSAYFDSETRQMIQDQIQKTRLLLKPIQDIEIPSDDQLKHIAGIVINNAGEFQIKKTLQDSNLIACLAVEFSLLNHSCRPNVGFEFRDGIIHIYALRNIEKDEELCHHYILPFCDTQSRQKMLLERYYFMCDCEFCLSDPVELCQIPLLELELDALESSQDYEKAILIAGRIRSIKAELFGEYYGDCADLYYQQFDFATRLKRLSEAESYLEKALERYLKINLLLFNELTKAPESRPLKVDLLKLPKRSF
jgi:hypothetical protein